MREFVIVGIVLLALVALAFATGFLDVRVETQVLCTDEGDRRIEGVPQCTPELRKKYMNG